MSTTTEPQVGEWWERGWPCTLADCPIGLFEYQGELCLKTEYGTNDGRIDAYIVSSGEFFWGGGGIAGQRKVMVTPVQVRIPDPPAPEPTKAEKIEARRVHAIKWLLADVDALTVRDVVRSIRASDSQAGYVLVPTSGEGFERMVRAMRAVDDGISTGYADWLRAAIEAAKGDA